MLIAQTGQIGCSRVTSFQDSFYHEKEFKLFHSYFKTGQKILDIGCANGIHVPLFLGVGSNVKYEGLDISKSFLEIARSRYPQLTFMEGDVSNAETLPKEKFDGFWAVAVLMHIPEDQWDQMLMNIQKIMKPGAIGYLTVPQERFGNSEADPRHFTIFTPDLFKSTVNARGWKILESGYKGATNTNDWLWFMVQLPG